MMIPGRMLKRIVLLVGEAVLASLAVGMFWYQDWQYSLPTPPSVAPV